MRVEITFCEKRVLLITASQPALLTPSGLTSLLSPTQHSSISHPYKLRVVIGLTEHNRLRRYLHIMGLTKSLLCRTRGAEDENSAHTLCECEASASLRLVRIYLGSFILDPEDIKSVSGGHQEL